LRAPGLKPGALIGAAVGAALLAWLLWRAGLGAVAHAMAALGPGGWILVLLFQLGLGALAGWAWALLGRGRPDARPARFVLARLVREAGAQILPFSHLSGVALGGRALALEGVDGGFAFASTIRDVAVELTSQVAYVALGAALLEALRPGRGTALAALGVAVVLAAMAGALRLARRHGPGLLDRLAARAPGRRMRAMVERLHASAAAPSPAAAAGPGPAFAAHLLAWILSGTQTWITLRLLGAPVGLPAALAIDAVTSGAKAVAFAVPGGLGVQEGALVLLGQAFGIPPSTSVALSLVRRGRDLALAAPVLALWQLRHGARIWRVGPDRTAVDGSAKPPDAPYSRHNSAAS